MLKSHFTESTYTEPDLEFEQPLRPRNLQEFIGQEAIRARLDVFVGAARERNEAVGHCLFSGPPGLGKTTLANILANSMGANLVVTSGPAIGKPGDLAGMLTKLGPRDLLFIDEIHRLSRVIEEYLYRAMEDFTLDLVIDSGPAARSVEVKLHPFTLVGATTKLGLVSSPLRSRFGQIFRLDYYPKERLQTIVSRTATLLGVAMSDAATEEVAKRARGTPRIANNLVRWLRDYAQMERVESVDRDLARAALVMLSIDERGLDELDQRLLKVLIDHYQGGPVGLSTLAVATGEDKATLEEVYEPYLIAEGFIERTPRGRRATKIAYDHLGRGHL